MATITVSFDSESTEDMDDFDVWRKGRDYQSVLGELDEHLRTKLKYEELDEAAEKAFQETRDRLYTLLEERGLSLW